MIKSLQNLSTAFILFLTIATTQISYAQCTGFSFAIEDMTVTSMTTSGIFFSYTIRNTGATAVSTNNLIINTTISTDQAMGSDLATGGTTIGGSVTIDPNETYTGSYQTSQTNYPTYPFLGISLEYGVLGVCQQTVDQEFECLRPDAEIVSFTINSTQASAIDYEFELKNVGGDTLFLNQLLLENFLSIDNTYDGSDASAGSTTVTIPAKTYLKATETGTVAFTTSGAVNGYSYLIPKLTYSEQAECRTSNNQVAVTIPPVSGIFDAAATESNSILWNSETKSFTVQHWDNAGSLNYQLFNASGALQTSGNTSAGVATSINAQQGFYILVITDGQKRYSKKIVY